MYTLRRKVLQSTFFWCFRLSQIEDSIQYLEGPNGIWSDHDRHIGVPADPNVPIMVLPDTIWSFQVLNRVLYLWQSEAPKKVLGITFFLRVYSTTHFLLPWQIIFLLRILFKKIYDFLLQMHLWPLCSLGTISSNLLDVFQMSLEGMLRERRAIDGSLRLANGADKSVGRLEIYHRGVWGAVCDDKFDQCV